MLSELLFSTIHFPEPPRLLKGADVMFINMIMINMGNVFVMVEVILKPGQQCQPGLWMDG
jgi:hypothetical protein